MENVIYLGSTISSNLSLDTALNQRIVKAAAAQAHLGKRVWDNSLLAISTKTKLYQSRVLSTLLYGSETWTLYSCQERRLNIFHPRCLRRILEITWEERFLKKDFLAQAGVPNMFGLLR